MDSSNPNGWSFGAWFKVTADQTGRIISKKTSGAGYALYYNATNDKLETAGSVSACNNNTTAINSARTVNDGQWHYSVVTLGATNPGTLTLYLDGIAESSSTGNYYCDVAADLTIGQAASAEYFKGVMDSAFVYRRALTAAEILANYQAGNIELQTSTGTDATPNDGTGWED